MGRFLDPPPMYKGRFLDEPPQTSASSMPSAPINPFREALGIATDIGNSAAYGIPGILAQTSPRSGFVGLGARFAGAPEVGPPMNLPTAQTPVGQAIGLVGGLLAPSIAAKAAGSNIFRAGKFAKSEAQVAMANKVRQKFFQSRRVTGRLFDRQLQQLEAAHPEQKVNLMGAVENLKAAITQNPKLAQDIASGIRRQGNPLLQNVLDAPELAQALTLRDAQAIKATMGKIPTLAVKAKRGPFAQYLDTDLDLLDFHNAIREAEFTGFPQLKPVFQQFSAQKKRLALLQPKMKEGQLVGTLERGFREPEIKQAARSVFPPRTMKEIQQFSSARKLAKAAPTIGRAVGGVLGIGGSAGTAAYLMKKLFG